MLPAAALVELSKVFHFLTTSTFMSLLMRAGLPSEDNLLHSDIALQEDEATDDPFQGLEDEKQDPFTNLEESEDGEDHGEED